MDEIKNYYNSCCSVTSDINEHLPKLLEYANKCETITEMGVRWVTSTWAFLLSNPKKIISYDIEKDPNINKVLELSKKYNINYKFEVQDVLKIEIDETDLLFIDTLHTYNQLFLELQMHSKKVKKFIILHDTDTYGYEDERIYERASIVIKDKKIIKQGLWNAVLDFLNTEEGNKWKILERLTNNNGLTILKRI